MTDVDSETVRITKLLAPLLAGENPAHVAATLTLMLASYLTLMSIGAGADEQEVDDMVDKLTETVRNTTHYQRAHRQQPGNA